MSYSNSVKSLLDIQDLHIIFEESCVKEGIYKGKTCKYISEKLTYDPTHCENVVLRMLTTRFLKNGTQVYSVEDKYYLLFGQRLETSIIEEMLDYDPALKANYELYQELYQELLQAVTNKDFEALSSCLTNPLSPLISSYMRTNLKTLRKHLPFIQNTLIYPYNNGRIEGINNKIKVLNRVAYGYRNFQNYKKRIILDFKLKPLETSHKQKTI